MTETKNVDKRWADEVFGVIEESFPGLKGTTMLRATGGHCTFLFRVRPEYLYFVYKKYTVTVPEGADASRIRLGFDTSWRGLREEEQP